MLTDNNPLTYILTTLNLDVLGHRWVAALARYNMSIRNLKGSDNKVADALSQIETWLDPNTVMELLNHAKGTGPRAEIEDIQVIEEEERADQEVILRTIQLARQDKKFCNLRTEDWHRAQLMDPVIPHVLDWLRLPRNNRVKLKDFLQGKVSEADCRVYSLREKDFERRDHLLFIKTTPPENVGTIPVFVVPVNRRQVAIDMCHRNAGHQGRDQTLSLLKGWFWWPRMSTALCLSLQSCSRCKQFEAKSQLPGMEPIMCTQPMELVHIDYVGMEVTVSTKEKPVVKNVLVVVDHFTRYVQAFVTNNHTAFTTARVLYNNFFSVFGFPQRLMSDQGTEFTSDVIAAMCKLLGIEKIRTTPYHPQGNGSAERVHQTLQRMIGKLDPEKRRKWPEHIRSMIIAYNAMWSQVTGYSPYFLMFGWRPRLPVDLLFPTVNNREWTCTIDEYVKTLYEWLRECLKLAQESATKKANRQKRLYDRKVGAVELRPGDRVLVHLDAFRGQRRKLKNQWGDDIHTVIERKADGIPVYEVKNKRTGKKKVLHWARLLLWLADYGEPVRCNLMVISDTLPRTVPDQQLEDSGEGLHPVPGERLQYGLDLTLFMAIIDNPKPMTSCIGREVRTGVPRHAAGQRIPTDCEEIVDPDCLGSYVGDVPVS